MIKILFIEDDPDLARIIVLALQGKGYGVCYANTLSSVHDMIEKELPNILLLDLEVGDQSALDYLPSIHAGHPALPILIASSHNEGKEIARCYEAGASHYTKKPYDIQEIDFLLQRFCEKPRTASNRISIGDYQLELSSHTLYYKQTPSKILSPKDFKLLHLLSKQPNRPVSREELFREVWDGQDAPDNAFSSPKIHIPIPL